MQKLNYTALEKITVKKPTNRLDFIAKSSIDKYVLDLGALDETAYELKQNTTSWLHQRIAEKAKFVRGIDNSTILAGENLTPFSNSIIQQGNVYDLEPIVNKHGVPDLIVAGELIEHLPNCLEFLQTLKSIPSLKGTRFIFTTPNACSLHNAIIGLFKRESTHEDHLTILSYKTLNTLCQRAEFTSWNLQPYYMKFPEMISKTTGVARWSTVGFEKFINVNERFFPLLSGGWVADVII